MLVAARFNLFG
jgi:hypothetical protein